MGKLAALHNIKKNRVSSAPKPRLPLGEALESLDVYEREGIRIFWADVSTLYDEWPSPIAIISDGAYGIAGGSTKERQKKAPRFHLPQKQGTISAHEKKSTMSPRQIEEVILGVSLVLVLWMMG